MFIAEWENAKRNKLVPFEGVVVDIGAFTGDTSLAYGLMAGPNGKVLAFEPNPYSFAVLRENAQASSERTNIECHQIAISDKEEEKWFVYSDSQFCNGGDIERIGDIIPSRDHLLEVNCAPLSKFIGGLDRIDFIKIDAEGSDLNVINGLRDIILKFKPILKAEMYPALFDGQRREFLEILESLNFQVFNEATGGKIPKDEFLRPRGFFDFIARPK